MRNGLGKDKIHYVGNARFGSPNKSKANPFPLGDGFAFVIYIMYETVQTLYYILKRLAISLQPFLNVAFLLKIY